MKLADHHEQISRYALHAGLPQEIVEQFEMARNVYLYAWFVYRFYPVAEHHSLAAWSWLCESGWRRKSGPGSSRRKSPCCVPC
jgi:hypothetical protein